MFATFFFNAPPPTELYTLSLHDALPISVAKRRCGRGGNRPPNSIAPTGRGSRARPARNHIVRSHPDRKSTRLNSSHSSISYAVFCLKKKNKRKRVGALLSQAYARLPRPV